MLAFFMNYLAHLHIASHCNSSPLGNLLGDFVRGDPSRQPLTSQVVEGIHLHRWVDRFTDESDMIAQAKTYFPKNCRRFSPIALDIFWDHLLAVHWSQFSSVSLDEFCRAMYQQCSDESLIAESLPSEFVRVSNLMWSENWLQSYRHWENTQYAIERLSKKKACYAPLAWCNEVLDDHYSTFNAFFEPFYLQLLRESISYVRNNFR